MKYFHGANEQATYIGPRSRYKKAKRTCARLLDVALHVLCFAFGLRVKVFTTNCVQAKDLFLSRAIFASFRTSRLIVLYSHEDKRIVLSMGTFRIYPRVQSLRYHCICVPLRDERGYFIRLQSKIAASKSNLYLNLRERFIGSRIGKYKTFRSIKARVVQ